MCCGAQLSRLVVDDCAKVDDDAMTAVIEGCPLLTFFSARRCPLITHITLYLLGITFSLLPLPSSFT
jgi:hypothetical protein